MGTILIIGGNGFVGYNILKQLVKEGKSIRCVNRTKPEQDVLFDSVDYRIGDAFDKVFLEESLIGIDTVLDFVSTTMPNTKSVSLENEINTTLRYYDQLLSVMVKNGIQKYIFPSSGGAIYGSRQKGEAKETDLLLPSTPYGVGKKMAEDIIHYYAQKCGLEATILRIGNVYGSQRYRDRPQGVVDVFIQNALEEKPIVIWGNANSAIRDYVYLEDVARAVSMVIESGINGVNTFNVGTGKGTSVEQIVYMIEEILGKKLTKEFKKNTSSGIDQIVLSTNKISETIGWTPTVSIDEGIRRTIQFKEKLLT